LSIIYFFICADVVTVGEQKVLQHSRDDAVDSPLGLCDCWGWLVPENEHLYDGGLQFLTTRESHGCVFRAGSLLGPGHHYSIDWRLSDWELLDIEYFLCF